MRGLREYIRINPQTSNFDLVYEILVESDIIPDEISDRCNLEITLVNRNFQVILSARTSADAEFCRNASAHIATVINDPTQYIEFLPEMFQFASAALAVGQLDLLDLQTDIIINGAMPVASATSIIAYVAIIIACKQ